MARAAFGTIGWRRAIVALGVLIALVAWQQGTFDYMLVNIGLNAKPCARNGFGAVFCGEDLQRYNREVAEPAQRARRDMERAVNELQRFRQ